MVPWVTVVTESFALCTLKGNEEGLGWSSPGVRDSLRPGDNQPLVV